MIEENFKRYVLGFFVDPSETNVVLIRKLRPDWQVQRLNGVGGKLESYEIVSDGHFIAMRREFKEEAGVDVKTWQHTVTIANPNWCCFVFIAHGDINRVKTMTDEKVEIHKIKELPSEIIENLRWLIPLSLDKGLQFPISVCHKGCPLP